MALKYDYLIVGAGLYGSIMAYELTKIGKRCLVIDKRDHIGGNCYTENVGGINVHKYGPHIFHTSNKCIWDYVNSFVEFKQFMYRPKVSYLDNIYSFPINLMTLYQIYGVKTPIDAINTLATKRIPNENPSNLEEWATSMIGNELYNIFIYGYTKKQWNTDPKNLPIDIIKRIPIRFNFDDNYFNDTYQGIPIGGYTKLFDKLLSGVDVELNVDFLSDRVKYSNISHKIIYTGPIDAFYDYKFERLDYRSLRFEEYKLSDVEDYQGNSVVNYTHESVKYTRIIEHKHFDGTKCSGSIITKEYPANTGEPYYPINNTKNQMIYSKYKDLTKLEKNVIFGGRLAEYKYYDMHQVIASALNDFKKITQ